MMFRASSSWSQSIHGFLSNNLIFIFPINILMLFFILPLLIIPMFMIYIQLKRKYFHCKCDICHSYVTSSWSKKFTNLCDWYTHLLQKSPTKTIHIHVLDNIITSNPQNVEYILKTNFNNYPKGKPFSTILGDLLGHGIFNVDGDAWRFQRKMASLELHRNSVRSYLFQVVQEEIENQLIPYLSTKSKDLQEVDLQKMFRAFSFSTISRFSFGVKIEGLQSSESSDDLLKEFAVSFDLATKLSAERALEVFSISWKLKRYMNIGSEKKLRDAIKKIDSLAMDLINKRRKLLIAGCSHTNQKDLLSRFMGVINNNDQYLRDIIVSFVLAGRDTVASTLTSFFLLVATHPQVEANILSEVNQVINGGKNVLTYDQIRGLHYLPGALYECMRIYPPVQFDSKFALSDDVLVDTMRVKKGTRVTYHPYAMGRMEEIWGKDCLEFKPERWLKDGVFLEQNPYKYPVFQAGVRVCLGKEIALMEIKCVIISILTEFHLELVKSSSQIPQFSPGLTATFKGGLPIILHRREKKS